MKNIMYRDAVRDAIREEMLRDEKVFIMGEDVATVGGVFKTTRGLLEEFGEKRVRNTPISEAAIVSAAAGASMAGARAIAEIMYIDFTACCMDSIANQVAKMRFKTAGKINVPMVIRTQGGRGRSSGCTQSQSLEAWFTHIPGLKIVAPSNPYDAKGLLKSSIRDNDPVIFIEHKALYQTKGDVPEEEYLIPLGKAEIKKAGSDITVITYSRQVLVAIEAAEELEKRSISAEILDLRSLVPLDFGTIAESVKKTGRVLIVHEACGQSGFGAEVLAQVQEKLFDYLDAPIVRITGRNIPVPHAGQAEKETVPTPERIIAAAEAMI